MKKLNLIVLHGWGLSEAKFQPLVAELRDLGFAVYCPDLPGFGKSQVPDAPLWLSDYAIFLHGYIKENGIKNPILIGHSFGGRVALKYDQMYPESIKAIILSGTPGFSPIPRKKLILFIILAKIGKIAFSLPPLSFIQDSVRKWYYYVVGAKEFFRAEGPMRETFKHVVAEDLVRVMEQVSAPTYLIWGELDIIVPCSVAERMQRVLPQSTLRIVPNADHGVPFKEPHVFATYVRQALES